MFRLYQLIESASASTHREPVQSSPFDAERIDYLQLDACAARAFGGNGSSLSLFWQSDVTDQDLPGLEVAPEGATFASPITLALVPSLYLLVDDVQRFRLWIWRLFVLGNR